MKPTSLTVVLDLELFKGNQEIGRSRNWLTGTIPTGQTSLMVTVSPTETVTVALSLFLWRANLANAYVYAKVHQELLPPSLQHVDTATVIDTLVTALEKQGFFQSNNAGEKRI